MDSCVDLVGLEMTVALAGSSAELVEDVFGLLPGGARGFPVAGGAMGVSQAAKYGGMVIVVTEFVVQVEGLLIAGGGVFVVAKVMMGVAQAVERVRLAAAVIEFLLPGKRLRAEV